MKYTTKVKQAQLVGGVRIEPNGGDLNQEQIDKIKSDPWGKELLQKEFLTIEGVKLNETKSDPKKGAVKEDAHKHDGEQKAK